MAFSLPRSVIVLAAMLAATSHIVDTQLKKLSYDSANGKSTFYSPIGFHHEGLI